MFPITEFQSCLERTQKLLAECQVRYYITGGAAAIAYGDPRTTQDVDIVVEAIPLQRALPQFFRSLKETPFLFNEQTIRSAIASGRQFQLIDIEASFKLDFYPAELSPGGFDRAVQLEIAPGLVMSVASRVDLAISKLIWIDKGSHRSRRDLRWILRRATSEELGKVRGTAAQLQLVPLLDEVLSESDEIDA